MAAAAVRALLDRHEVPKHRHASRVQEIFALSRAAAHRRTHGTAAWTLEELQLIAATFGESLPQMLNGGRTFTGTNVDEVDMQQLRARVAAVEQAMSKAITVMAAVLTDSDPTRR